MHSVWTLLARILPAISLAGCVSRPEAGLLQSKDAPLAVVVAEAVEQEVERRVEVTGTLGPIEESTLSIEVEGRVVEIKADLSSPIRKGDVLARVDAREYAWRKTQAEAEMTAAEVDLKRTGDLATRNIATAQQLDEGRRRASVARASAELARKKLADTTLRAPFDGVVARRLVNENEYVRAGTPLFHVVRTSPLKLRADVPERFSGDLKPGDEVVVVSEALAGLNLKGKVVRVGPTVAIDTRSFPVEAEIENPEDRVKPGTFVRATIVTGTRSRAVTVPESAVAAFAGNPRVFVVAGGKALERPVEVSGRRGGKVWITRGLTAGDRVATTAVDLLSDGRAVEARER